jgi:hypothetical protein
MKLLDTLLLATAAAFIIIGIHQSMVLGFSHGYWAVMLATLLFFVYTFRKRK